MLLNYCVAMGIYCGQNWRLHSLQSTCCCGASVASEQQHKQDLRRIYKRENEFSKSSLFTRMLCGFLPECFAAFYQNALRLLPECIAPQTTRGCDTVVMASCFWVDCNWDRLVVYGFTCKAMWARSCLAFPNLAVVVVNAEFESLENLDD